MAISAPTQELEPLFQEPLISYFKKEDFMDITIMHLVFLKYVQCSKLLLNGCIHDQKFDFATRLVNRNSHIRHKVNLRWQHTFSDRYQNLLYKYILYCFKTYSCCYITYLSCSLNCCASICRLLLLDKFSSSSVCNALQRMGWHIQIPEFITI